MKAPVPAPNQKNIGSLLLDSGKITAPQAEQVLKLQKEEGLRFGEAAVRLGLVSEEDIRQMLARQFDYPYLLPGEGGLSNELVAAYAPFSPQVENLRALRIQLMLRWLDQTDSTNAIVIVSPGRGEGRSWLAANLAVVFSQMGEHTLLVDADLRNPRQHRLFGVDNRQGLAPLLANRLEESPLARVPDFRDLTVLPAGPVPPNPQELLCCSTFGQLMHKWVNEFDVVLIDTPAATVSADAQAIAARTGGALLIGRQHHTRLAELAGMHEQLAVVGAKVIGSVVNQF